MNKTRRFLLTVILCLCLNTEAAPSTQPFELQTLDTRPVNPWLKAVGDLDGDGRVDVVIGAAARGGLVAYLNRFPKWDRQVIDAERRFSTDGEVADLDGDGRQDLVVLTLGPDTVAWYRQTATGWAPQVLANQTCHDLEVADFDGDGQPDIVGRNQREWPAKDDAGNHLHFLWQQRQGINIAWNVSRLDCPPGEGLLALDLDADGDQDIAMNGIWFENLGQRRWQEHAFARPEDWSHPNTFVASADFNGDGRSDLVLAPSELKGGRYRIAWFEAPVDPRRDGWRAHVVMPEVETVCHFVGAADFDGDSRPDIAYAQMPQGTDPDHVKVLLNRGRQREGEWTDAWEPLMVSENGSHSMRILDANGDGFPDLLGANWSAQGQDENVKLWINRLTMSASARVLPTPYGPDVEAWWANHPFNPQANRYAPLGSVRPPEPVIQVRATYGGNIQAAIDALPKTGGTLFFEPGVYEDGFKLVGKSNVHFVSDGGAIIRAQSSIAGCPLALCYADINAWLVNKNDSPTRREARACVTTQRIQNIYFRNLTFDGAGKVGQSLRVLAAEGVVFEGVTFQNYLDDPKHPHPASVQVESVNGNVWFRGCTFRGPNRFGVRFDGAHHSGVVECVFDHDFTLAPILVATYSDITADYDGDGELGPYEKRIVNYFVMAHNRIGEQGSRPSMRNAIVGKASNILIQSNEVLRPVQIFADLSGECQIPGSGQYVVYGHMHYDYLHQKLIGNTTHSIQVFLHEDTSPTNCGDPKGSMTVGRYTVRENHIVGQPQDQVRLVWEGPHPAAGPNLVTNNCFAGKLQGKACPVCAVNRSK